ncbi:Metabotropic glutamate receptor 6 [Seminavis robusta]|uniref:Metabotropic glutamate receptor 6 n=1 Tax=Seminavis robusta TaxID=568900 RepID=A0A9N8EMF6_9STRA|nr:Metabotropic glutamate receptor 6 [Seminavis robusta]|eukprot:Sro1469_g275290.1 Metabotropic glutamate receptor 6 (815) ;mRNA; r:1277-3744
MTVLGDKSSSYNLSTSHGLTVLDRKVGSEVLEVFDGFSNETYRNVHVLSLKPIMFSRESTGPLEIFQLSFEAAGYIAARHFNERNSSILPDLGERLVGCDIKLSYEMANTMINRLVALKALQEAATRPNMPLGAVLQPDQWKPRPTVINGPASSTVSLAVASLAGVYEIPQISGTASSTVLDDKARAPFFSRSYPTNQADAEALMIYFKSIGVTHFGSIYSLDAYGSSFGEAVNTAATKHGIVNYFTAYEIGRGVQPFIESLQYLKSTQVKYFFGIFDVGIPVEDGCREAHRQGIMGFPGYTWILTESESKITSADFSLDNETDADIAKAIHGVGVLLPGITIHPVLEQIMTEDFKTDRQLQEGFVNAHQPNLLHFFDDFNFSITTLLPSIYAAMVYDAVMTAGLAACDQTERFFSSEQLLTGIRQQAFGGATGYVSYNNVTGTRDLTGLRYAITNVIIAPDNQQLTPGRIRFNPITRTAIEFPSRIVNLGHGPFIYSDNTTSVPEALPHVDMDMNLIPLGVQGFGWGLMGCIAFALHYRSKRAVASAQPAFLVMIASGCLVMATAIIPMSLQEPIPASGLDIACMSQWYLVCLGLCSFSALFCKLYRINKLQLRASQFRRVQVNVKDVLFPLVIMVGLNLVVLVTWSVVDPLVWERETEHSRDRFDRPTSSIAVCASNSQTLEKLFGALLFAISFVALALANWESYKGRKLPTEFNETGRIAMSMFFLIEAIIIGSPILLAAQGNPTATFLVKAMLIFCTCLAIIGPIFLPIWSLQIRREKVKLSGRASKSNPTAGETSDVVTTVTAQRCPTS